MVRHFIEHFTYLGLFLVLFAAGLGLPIPEEVPILAGGVLAQQEVVRWWIALPVCLAGVLAGDTALYWIGRHWGDKILDWRPVRRVLSYAREEALKAGYRKHGVKIVFLARHVMGLRAAAFLTAGIAGVPFWRFLAVDSVAALIGVPIGFGLAFLFTDHLERTLEDVRRVERWLVLYAMVGLAAWLAWLAWRQNRRL
jgi:membrane protein DedA with SNARE-associated domain